MLEEELNKEPPVNVDEPSSYLPIPFTPLFIAYINDHYQVTHAHALALEMKPYLRGSLGRNLDYDESIATRGKP